jgi:hypothetical protein
MCQIAEVIPAQSNEIGKSNPSTMNSQLMVSAKRRRRVRFQRDDSCDNDVVVVHHETAAISEEELQAYFMQPQDFERCNESTKEAIQKWIRHKQEMTPIDEEHFSIRGLEEILDHMKYANCPGMGREWQRLNHVQVVLNEIRQRRRNNISSTVAPLDEEQIRCVSEQSSTAAVERAIKMAKNDRCESSSSTTCSTPSRARSSLSLKEPMYVSATRRVDKVVENACNHSVQSSPPPPPPKELTTSNKKARRLFGFMVCS